MRLKSDVICNICQKVVNNPVFLPCHSVVCGDHMNDNTARNNMLKCEHCQKEFEMPINGFPICSIVNSILQQEFYLNVEGRDMKHSIQDLIYQLDNIQHNLKSSLIETEVFIIDFFSEIRRQIDIHRELVHKKFADAAINMNNQTEDEEKNYMVKLKCIFSQFVETNIAITNCEVINEFRKSN